MKKSLSKRVGALLLALVMLLSLTATVFAAGTRGPASYANPFKDVKAKDFYYNAVLWAVANGITYAPLREALSEQPDQTLNCYIGFVSASPIEFLINPWTLTYNVTYDGEEHKVQVLFYVYSAYSFGSYDATSQELTMKIVEGALYVDGKQSPYLASDLPIVFKSGKKL